MLQKVCKDLPEGFQFLGQVDVSEIWVFWCSLPMGDSSELGNWPLPKSAGCINPTFVSHLR